MFSRRFFKIQNVQKMSKRRIIVFTWLQRLPSQHKMFSRRLFKIQNVQKMSKRHIIVFTWLQSSQSTQDVFETSFEDSERTKDIKKTY